MALDSETQDEILTLVFSELKDIFEDENVLTTHLENEEIQKLRKTIRSRLENRLKQLKTLDDLEQMS